MSNGTTQPPTSFVGSLGTIVWAFLIGVGFTLGSGAVKWIAHVISQWASSGGGF
jgi:hypothetical protein